jgi:hypothetical protein
MPQQDIWLTFRSIKVESTNDNMLGERVVVIRGRDDKWLAST